MKIRNITFALAGLSTLVFTSCDNRSIEGGRTQMTQKQLDKQSIQDTQRSHPLPGLYEKEEYQRHVNPHLYNGVKK